jgi:hypothetical protein
MFLTRDQTSSAMLLAGNVAVVTSRIHYAAICSKLWLNYFKTATPIAKSLVGKRVNYCLIETTPIPWAGSKRNNEYDLICSATSNEQLASSCKGSYFKLSLGTFQSYYYFILLRVSIGEIHECT